MIELVEWDTAHFGIRVGNVTIPDPFAFDYEHLKQEAISGGYDVVYIKSPQRIASLDKQNVFCDEKIVYTQPFVYSQVFNIDNKSIVSWKNKDINSKLKQLALDSGKYSRYKLDTNYSDKIYEKLYIDWMTNSVRTDFATDVLAYIMNGTPVGMLTYKINDNTSSIGIISVDENFRGLHIGSKLIDYYKGVQPSHVSELSVVTQGVNIPAKRFYERNGYHIQDISYIYHCWIK